MSRNELSNDNLIKKLNKEQFVEIAFLAIEKNDLNTVINLLKKQFISPDEMNRHGYTLLQAAIKRNNADMVYILLKFNANPNISGCSSEWLIFHNNLVADEFGFEHKLNGISPLMTALNSCDSNGVPITPNIHIINLLLEKGANVNHKESTLGLTPLHFAANQCYPQAIKVLITAGAEVNAESFNDRVFDKPRMYKCNPTPIILAAQSYSEASRINSVKCVNELQEMGADIAKYSYIPVYFGQLLSILAEKNMDKALEILNKKLSENFEKMDYVKVKNTINTFLSSNRDLRKIDEVVQELLGKDTDNLDFFRKLEYFTRLNSWVGVISGDFNRDIESNQDNENNLEQNHFLVSCEGWSAHFQSFINIKYLFNLLINFNNNKFDDKDLNKQFSASKSEIIELLKDEIYNQVTTYYSSIHSDYYDSLEKSYENLRNKFIDKLVNYQAEKIGNLGPNESFCLPVCSDDHTAYMQFKANENRKLSIIIYNSGGGSALHPVSSTGKIYPYVNSNISQELFKKHDTKALVYLSYILNAQNYSWYNLESYEGKEYKFISLNFMKIYAGISTLGGEKANENDLKNFIPKKEDLIGANCVVQNNYFAMKNRLGSNLAKLKKIFDIIKLKKDLIITNKLIKFKENEVDILKFKTFLDKFGEKPDTKLLEMNLFNFLRKRADSLPSEISDKPAERIATVFKAIRSNSENREVLENCLNSHPQSYKTIYRIAEYFNSQSLKKEINQFRREYEVSGVITQSSPEREGISEIINKARNGRRKIISKLEL